MQNRVLGGICYLGVFLCLACGGPIMETKLDGFDQGKRVFKMNFLLEKAKTPVGEEAMSLKTLVHYSVGTKVSIKNERQALLKKDFSLISTTATNQSNRQGKNSSSTMAADVQGSKITVRHSKDGQPEKVQVLEHLGPVYIELHSLLYFNEVAKKDQAKTYPVLHVDDESGEAQVGSVEIRYLGEVQFYEDNVSYQSRHYQIQAITKPDEYDDYYLDIETGNILKIEFGFMKFVPAKS